MASALLTACRPASGNRGKLKSKPRVVIGVHPEDLEGPAADATNAVTFQLTVTEQLGNSLLVYGHIGEGRIVASLDRHSIVEVDSMIHLKITVNTLHVFDLETAETLI